MNRKQKRIKTAALILAVLLTLLTAGSVFALRYTYGEMRHEGLTYSQWYEGSVAGFYSCQFFAVLTAGLTAAAWYLFFRKPERRELSPGRKRLLKILLCILIPAALGLVILALVSRGEMKAAQAAYAEGLAAYISAYGKYRVAALLSCEALGAVWFMQRKR